ncbi:MAG: DUF2235 domain-containing protein [Hyphomicrobiales bacterium]|nr:DUF2235 domain-containing protein [Hyphomicrobiales bacterium]
MGKKIVVFADGTGNSFFTQESNIWRLYQALDESDPDQIAFYIPGVGTSGFRPFAILDGATGVGVPANVRKLYRFICWNWREGDKIYAFGFSRGAFTIRTLVAMIESQGLAPTKIGGSPATHADMVRNSMSAWRAYRRQTAPWTRTLPTIWAARAVRDALLFARDAIGSLFGRKTWKQVVDGRDPALAGKDARGANTDEEPGVPIHFVGLFDTVEAYGVPIEELRRAVDWSIWPISFRNHRISDKARNVRHALSIDDERTTFHPLRFDVTDAGDRIREVWFAGVHSDVGGGYPDSGLSFVPLAWIARDAAHFGLKLKPEALGDFEAQASALAPSHDSRAGAAVLYRYEPRAIRADEQGRPPVVHFSVAEKMVFGSDNYAPVTLPADCSILGPDGVAYPIESFRGRSAQATELRARVVRSTNALGLTAERSAQSAANALEQLHKPDEKSAQRALEAVWWRRVAYFALFLTVAAIALLPVFVESLSDKVIKLAGEGGADVDSALGAIFTPLRGALEAVLPSYAQPYISALSQHPTVCLATLAFAGLVWWWGNYLRDAILDFARAAWSSDRRKPVQDRRLHAFLRVASIARANRSAAVHLALRDYVVPALATVALLGALALVGGRIWFAARLGYGDVCTRSTTTRVATENGTPFATAFATHDFCAGSGVSVEANRKYRIWIAIEEPWFDRTIMTGVHGFGPDALHLAFTPLKRSLSAAWFQPVLRIGSTGVSEIVLTPLDATVPDAPPRERIAAAKDPEKCRANASGVIDLPFRYEQSCALQDPDFRKAHPGFEVTGTHYDPLTGPTLAAAKAVWDWQDLPRTLVADFVADRSGELFLYANDAVAFFPMFWLEDGFFYRNNSGTAHVVVQALPLPSAPR